MATAKNWVFTINNPTEGERHCLMGLEHNEKINYAIFQLEAGENGTPHYQGYFQLVKKSRFNAAKRFISERAHIEVAKGTPADNKAYCSKEPRLEPTVEFGVITVQGKRNDIDSFVLAMNDKILSDSEIYEQFPSILAKYPRFVTTSRRILSEKAQVIEPLVPRPGWQTELVEYLAGTPDNRKVRWYVDALGASGKSWFTRRYRFAGQAPFVVTGGKYADIQYAYQRERVVIFDWARSGEETFPYSLVENFKNGYFLQTKYESCPCWFNIPHVIIFTNFEPDKSKLSADRWDVHNIRKI